MSNSAILFYVIVSLSIGYAFVLPAYGDINTLIDERGQQEEYLEMVGQIEAKKIELQQEFDNISAEDKKYIETILPNSFNFVRLVSQIDAVGSKYGISIDKTSFKETSITSNNEEESQKSYKSATIGFSFDASYEQFNRFMGDLEKSLRIMDIKSMKLNTKDTGPYSYTVEFEVYWLK